MLFQLISLWYNIIISQCTNIVISHCAITAVLLWDRRLCSLWVRMVSHHDLIMVPHSGISALSICDNKLRDNGDVSVKSQMRQMWLHVVMLLWSHNVPILRYHTAILWQLQCEVTDLGHCDVIILCSCEPTREIAVTTPSIHILDRVTRSTILCEYLHLRCEYRI